jgi:hypothetical protein
MNPLPEQLLSNTLSDAHALINSKPEKTAIFMSVLHIG